MPQPSATRGCSAPPISWGSATLLDRKPSQLSGGQQQRVALGRAIVAETPVCLMDEPLSNLDAQLRVEMRREIRALQQRLGITMLYVTHDQLEAMTMADQVVLMRDGPHRAGRPARRALRAAGDHLHRALRRHAADERAPGNAARPDAGKPAARGSARARPRRHAGGRRARRSGAARRRPACRRGLPRSNISAPIR